MNWGELVDICITQIIICRRSSPFLIVVEPPFVGWFLLLQIEEALSYPVAFSSRVFAITYLAGHERTICIMLLKLICFHLFISMTQWICVNLVDICISQSIIVVDQAPFPIAVGPPNVWWRFRKRKRPFFRLRAGHALFGSILSHLGSDKILNELKTLLIYRKSILRFYYRVLMDGLVLFFLIVSST